MIVGIDLGTTNSLLAVWHDGSPRIVRSATGRDLTPSAVSVAEDGHILVGDAARDRLVSHPERSIGYFKRFMGSDRQLTIAGRQFRPEELSALVIRQLLDDAEADTGARPTDAVISVPAYFSDAQRKATRTAGQLAGLNVERLVNEPTAAAMAYGLHELADERLIVVIDLGGGTLDVSILEFFDGVMEVHATAGDNHLGGRDFDESITTWFTKEIGLSIDELRTAEQARLIAASEAARHRLTDSDAAVLTLAQSRRFRGELVHQAELTRTTFESLCAPLLSRMQIAIERAIRDSKLSLDQITDVILVGGATRMALVRSLVSRMFQRIPLSRPDPDRIVAEGAAVQAALKARDASLKDVVLTDVCPYTLGIEVSEELDSGMLETGRYLPIIERNLTVPVSRVNTVAPITERQKQLKVNIFQGESRLVSNNILLGSVDVPLPRRGDRNVDVRFTYDVDGILEVEVVVPGREPTHLVINNSGTSLDEAEIAKRLKALEGLKVHPRDDALNIALLAKLDRLYEESLGASRDEIASVARAFEAALSTQDPSRVEDARAKVEAFMEAYLGQ